jgi:hypothetical protein
MSKYAEICLIYKTDFNSIICITVITGLEYNMGNYVNIHTVINVDLRDVDCEVFAITYFV